MIVLYVNGKRSARKMRPIPEEYNDKKDGRRQGILLKRDETPCQQQQIQQPRPVCSGQETPLEQCKKLGGLLAAQPETAFR